MWSTPVRLIRPRVLRRIADDLTLNNELESLKCAALGFFSLSSAGRTASDLRRYPDAWKCGSFFHYAIDPAKYAPCLVSCSFAVYLDASDLNSTSQVSLDFNAQGFLDCGELTTCPRSSIATTCNFRAADGARDDQVLETGRVAFSEKHADGPSLSRFAFICS